MPIKIFLQRVHRDPSFDYIINEKEKEEEKKRDENIFIVKRNYFGVPPIFWISLLVKRDTNEPMVDFLELVDSTGLIDASSATLCIA